MTLRDSEPRYVISVAASMVGIESHTLRYYERCGLVKPYRSKGNIRYYSERDIECLRHIKTLMDDLGINLAGVEVVMRMTEKVAEMQRQIEEMESKIEQFKLSKIEIKRNVKEGD